LESGSRRVNPNGGWLYCRLLPPLVCMGRDRPRFSIQKSLCCSAVDVRIPPPAGGQGAPLVRCRGRSRAGLGRAVHRRKSASTVWRSRRLPRLPLAAGNCWTDWRPPGAPRSTSCFRRPRASSTAGAINRCRSRRQGLPASTAASGRTTPARRLSRGSEPGNSSQFGLVLASFSLEGLFCRSATSACAW